MSDSPQIPQTPRHRFKNEYDDPHYPDEDEEIPAEDDERRATGNKPPPRRKPVYRPRRRFDEE